MPRKIEYVTVGEFNKFKKELSKSINIIDKLSKLLLVKLKRGKIKVLLVKRLKPEKVGKLRKKK